MTDSKTKTVLTNDQREHVSVIGRDLAAIVNAGHTARGCWKALSASLTECFPGKRWGVAPSRVAGLVEKGDMPKTQVMSEAQYARLGLLIDSARAAAIAALIEEHGEDDGKERAAEMPDASTIRSRAWQHSAFMAEKTAQKNARNNARKKAAAKTETADAEDAAPPTLESVTALIGNVIPMVAYIDRRTKDRALKDRLAVAAEHIREALEALESK